MSRIITREFAMIRIERGLTSAAITLLRMGAAFMLPSTENAALGRKCLVECLE